MEKKRKSSKTKSKEKKSKLVQIKTPKKVEKTIQRPTF